MCYFCPWGATSPIKIGCRNNKTNHTLPNSLIKEHFQLDFDKLRFPARLAVAALLGLIVSWAISWGTDWRNAFDLEQVIGHLLLAAVFVVLSSLFLKFFNDTIGQMRPIYGVAFAWAIVVIVAGAIYAGTFLTADGEGVSINIPYLRHIDVGSTGTLLLVTVLLGLPLFWTEKETYSVRALVEDSESNQFSNLGFRIRPHFLFNTLNSVAHLISLHPARAEKALYNLADVFRVVMADKRELVPLKAELELADKYLFLEKTRLGERLQVASRIDPESLAIMVPVLLLQPLLENAVYHGIETRFKGGIINLSVQIIDKQLIIQIANPLPEGSMKRTSGNQVAQENLRDRIYRTFGSRGTFDAHEADERYTVTIRIPL